MATKQYIGARYVPLITGAWTAGISYEPLTIVTYQNRSFTSKKPVPSTVGNPADNSEYWLETGNYNAQVSELQDEVTALENKVNAKERHIIFITASYGTKYTINGETITYSLDERFLQYSGWDSSYFHYSAVAGNGFCDDGFITQLENINIGSAAPEDIKDIYVMGGWNDLIGVNGRTAELIVSKALAFANYAKQNYPNARLHMMSAAWSYLNTNSSLSLRGTFNAFRSLERIGWIWHENLQYVLHMHSRVIDGDKHPTQAGVDAIAQALVEIINTDNCNIYFFTNSALASVTLNGTIASNGSLRIVQLMRNGLVDCQFVPIRAMLTFPEPVTLTFDGNHNITLFEFNEDTDYILRGYQTRTGFATTITFSNRVRRETVPCWVMILDRVVKAYLGAIPNDEGSSYQTMTNAICCNLPYISGTVQSL